MTQKSVSPFESVMRRPPVCVDAHDPDVRFPDRANGYIGDCRKCGAAVIRITGTIFIEPLVTE